MTLSGMNMLSDDSEDEVENIDPYRRKYQLLLERCEVLQQDNERLAFRTQETKKKRNRLRKLRKAIMDRLDKYGDEWRTVPLTIPDPAAETVVKTEKVSPKTSQKTKTSSGSGSDKAAQKAARSAASGSTSKRKSTPKTEKSDQEQSVTLKHPNNPFFVYCEDDQLAEQEAAEAATASAELDKQLGVSWNTLSADERKIYYNVYEQFKDQYIVPEMTVYKEEITSTSST